MSESRRKRVGPLKTARRVHQRRACTDWDSFGGSYRKRKAHGPAQGPAPTVDLAPGPIMHPSRCRRGREGMTNALRFTGLRPLRGFRLRAGAGRQPASDASSCREKCRCPFAPRYQPCYQLGSPVGNTSRQGGMTNHWEPSKTGAGDKDD